jgi:hypothetical protein
MSKMNQEQFFGVFGDEYVRVHSYPAHREVRVEDLYQHFKARLMAELAVSSPELLQLASLAERPDIQYGVSPTASVMPDPDLMDAMRAEELKGVA